MKYNCKDNTKKTLFLLYSFKEVGRVNWQKQQEHMKSSKSKL